MSYWGFDVKDIQVALGYAFSLGLGVGGILSLIRFLLFSSLERSGY